MLPDNRIKFIQELQEDNLELEMRMEILDNFRVNLSLEELEKVQDFAKVIKKEKKQPYIEQV